MLNSPGVFQTHTGEQIIRISWCNKQQWCWHGMRQIACGDVHKAVGVCMYHTITVSSEVTSHNSESLQIKMRQIDCPAGCPCPCKAYIMYRRKKSQVSSEVISNSHSNKAISSIPSKRKSMELMIRCTYEPLLPSLKSVTTGTESHHHYFIFSPLPCAFYAILLCKLYSCNLRCCCTMSDASLRAFCTPHHSQLDLCTLPTA